MPYPRKSGAMVWNRFDKCSVKTDIQERGTSIAVQAENWKPFKLTETLSFVCDILQVRVAATSKVHKTYKFYLGVRLV